MTLRVSGKNLAIGEALRTHVHSRIDGVVAKYHAGSPSGHVTIEPEGSGYRADCTLFLKSGMTLQVEAVAQEPYTSFDKAAERIERRLRDHRKRLTGRHGDSASGVIGAQESEAHEIGAHEIGARESEAHEIEADGRAWADGADEPEEETFPVVVAEQAGGFKEMTVAAAVHELDAAMCGVVIFRYAENRRINIVYRRADGNIGWIDPLGAAKGQ